MTGSKRATAFANGVNEYSATKSCAADGREGRCSIVRTGQWGQGTSFVKAVDSGFGRGRRVDRGWAGGDGPDDAIWLMAGRGRRWGMGWEASLRVVHCVEARMMAFGCGNRTFGFAC